MLALNTGMRYSEVRVLQWKQVDLQARMLTVGKSKSPTGEKSDPLKRRFHDLRHTAVTRLLEGGVPYPVVASMMGWTATTAIRMAKSYGHIGNRALREAADVLGGLNIPVESLKKSPKSLEAEKELIQ